MCTLTFVPKEDGYLVGMNRDEHFTRAAALPPAVFPLATAAGAAVYPYEPGGGTWIAANQGGVTLALLNRSDGQIPRGRKRSRGEIIPALIAAEHSEAATRLIAAQDFSHTVPFRVIAIFARERALLEWVWDGRDLRPESRPWKARHWFSSGLGDSLAELQRGAVCRTAWRDPAAGTRSWLRALHRSHDPERGPFSVCAHRGEAGTQAYTEVETGKAVRMFYLPGPPCAPGPPAEVLLPA